MKANYSFPVFSILSVSCSTGKPLLTGSSRKVISKKVSIKSYWSKRIPGNWSKEANSIILDVRILKKLAQG